MSTPHLAVEVVAELSGLGYGAAVDAPAEGDTSAFVTAWTTDDNGDVDGIAALVRRVDREAVPQPDRSDDAVDEQLVPAPEEVADDHQDAGDTVGAGGSGGREVRPRRVWAGVALALVGLVAVGAGMMVESWWVGGAGVVLLGLGVVLLLAGGGLHDVHSTRSVAHEVHDLRHDETHEGIKPGEMVDDTQAKRTAVAVDRRRRRLIRDAQHGERDHHGG